MGTRVRSRVGKSAGYAAKKLFFILATFVLITSMCTTAEAKSVYAITSHDGGTVKAYHIQGSQLVLSSTSGSIRSPLIDITVDSQRKLLFITVEGGGISCVDADTLVEKGYLSTVEMAGIVADEVKQRVYAIGRQTHQLYIYDWNGTAIVLINQVVLADLGSQEVFGIAMDKISRRLYVANNTSTVNYYDAEDPQWALLGTRDVGHAAMDIDVDSYRGYLYVGGYQEGSGGYNYLIKHNLRTEVNPNQVQDVGTAVVGIAVDPASGLVYVTTWDDYVRVYDCSGSPFVQTYLSEYNGDHPAGICVESFGGLRLTKVDDVSDNDCRSPLSTIIYEISWENTSDETVENVVLKDYLPAGVDFDEFVEGVVYQPAAAPPADPNVIYGITDANDLTDIILPVGQSIRLYLTKETFEEDVLSFYLEADISNPNLGWIDNTEYDPNNPGTAEILAQPRASFFDYYGPGYTQPEGIQFYAASFAGPMEDGNIASFIYTATQPGCVVLTLVDYNAVPATLEEIVIRQTDPNDPNYVPQELNEIEEPPAYSASSIEGVYNEPNHTVTWELGDIAPGGSGSVSFSVIVNEKSEPGMNLHNVAKLILGGSILAIATEDTPVCCWGGNVIYVNQRATGYNNGTNWTDAYTDLQDAIYRAGNSTCEDVNTIYVAQGEYSPGTRVVDSFVLPDGVSVYGGFVGWETSPDQRQIQTHPTILTGRIDPNNRNESVAVMGNNSLLDGVIVQDSGGYGILGIDVDFEISNCVVEENENYAIYADNSDASIKWCSIRHNGNDGIRHFDGETSITVENCQITRNSRNGIYDANSIPTIRNNVICGNGAESTGYFGMWVSNPKGVPFLYNNTIAYNQNEAIFYLDNDANHVNCPDVQNCIIWYNNEAGNGEQFAGWKVYPRYSCVYDPNDPDGLDYTLNAFNNFSGKPGFAYPYSDDPNVCINVHLAYDSFCKDKGNPNLSYEGQKDIDNEERVADGRVDVGADEINCDDVYNPLDWNADGIVNLNEFRKFSDFWLAHDPNDPAVLDPNSPENDPNNPSYIKPEQLEAWYPDGWKLNFSIEEDSAYSIDVADLLVFLDDSWLWVACWRHDIQEMQQMSMLMNSNNSSGQFTQSESALSEVEEMVPPVPLISMEISPPVETTVSVPVSESVETVETDPVAEREQIVSLLEEIDALIAAGGEDAETWQEIKILLEQTLAETEDTANDPNEF